jgi:hypothetical protein
MHISNLDLTLNRRTTLQLHSRFRTRDAVREFFQVRFGPIVQFNVNPRVTAIGGYYYIDQHYPGRQAAEWDDFNRYFGGASVRLVDRPKITVDWRGLAEKFHSTPGGDFTRLRSRGGVNLNLRTWMPYGTFEVLRANDTVFFRTGGGINRRMSRVLTMGFGYELRQAPTRALSHIIVTTVLVQPQRKE